MATHQTLRDAIFTVLRAAHECELEELVNTCSSFTWTQIFLEVDRLSRSGEVHLKRHSVYGYTLVLSPGASPRS